MEFVRFNLEKQLKWLNIIINGIWMAIYLGAVLETSALVGSKIVYNLSMAKRNTGVGKGKKKSPHKTQKRLAVKRAMLATKKNKKRRK